ncbi:MAG: hypothetical protein RLZ98_2877 [Pseudomonadota bacterium]|jgi:magnesium transporter
MKQYEQPSAEPSLAMINYHACENGRLLAMPVSEGSPVVTPDRHAVWIDLEHPTLDEIRQIERALGINIPSADDMKEIEVSSRLFHENGTHFMTASIVYKIDTEDPLNGEITFILLPKVLITVRFSAPRAIALFQHQAKTGDIPCEGPAAIATGIVEAIVEREADLIERLHHETEALSKRIFENEDRMKLRAKEHAETLREIGKASVIASRTRESLVSISRMLGYFHDVVKENGSEGRTRHRIRSVMQDARSLATHVDYVSGRLMFLMDATIGLVGIEQNQIIKLFSVVAVMLMPPTLIASIYGMNFRHMPELEVVWAYPAAIIAMVVSAVVPFVYFKHKGWL